MSVAPKTQILPKITLEVLKGPHKGMRHVGSKSTISIGRGSENDIALPEDPKISRKHIEIKNTGFEVTVVNVSQKNFVYFQDQLIDFKLITQPTEILIGETLLLIKPDISQKNNSPSIKLRSLPNTGDLDENFNSNKTHFTKTSLKNSQPITSTSGGVRFNLKPILLIVVACIGGYLFFKSDKIKSVNDRLKIRTQEDIAKELEVSDLGMKALRQKREQNGKDSEYYARAQENFLKGFRDYQLQQYQRSIQSFEAALTLFPQHELALTYKNRALRKLNEVIQRTMLQGRKYKEKGNIRLCISSFRAVLQLVKDSRDPIYKEAESLLSECEYILSQGLTK